jgi:hypothetical protein
MSFISSSKGKKNQTWQRAKAISPKQPPGWMSLNTSPASVTNRISPDRTRKSESFREPLAPVMISFSLMWCTFEPTFKKRGQALVFRFRWIMRCGCTLQQPSSSVLMYGVSNGLNFSRSRVFSACRENETISSLCTSSPRNFNVLHHPRLSTASWGQPMMPPILKLLHSNVMLRVGGCLSPFGT